MKSDLKSSIIIASCALFVAGCGGGVGDNQGIDGSSAASVAAAAHSQAAATAVLAAVGAPAAPIPAVSYQIKKLHFSWPAVAGATYYRLLENPDGVSGFTQVGANITATVVNHNIALYRRVNARYIVSACNTIGCGDSAPIMLAAHLIPAIGYVKASNTNANDVFGNSVALSADGSTLAVGAPQESSAVAGINGNQLDNSASQAGAVYVFSHTGGIWSQQAYIKASAPHAGDQFGYELSLSATGNKLAVSAPHASIASGFLGPYPNSGAAYVFTRASGVWSQQSLLLSPMAAANQVFGHSISLSGDGATLVVGEPDGSAWDTPARAGGVTVFTLASGVWSKQAYLRASNPQTGDFFGSSVSLADDGNTLAVGADFEASAATGINGNQADNSAPYAGAVYVFTRISGVWSQQAYIKASNTDKG